MEDFELTLFDRLNVIKDTINKYGEENFYVSFSGGKDSTVLHYMVDMALPENKIPRVYINTGIEYFDIVKFVKELQENDDRIVIVNNTRNIRKVLEEKGYPFKSKDHSKKVREYQRKGMVEWVQRYVSGRTGDGKKSKFECPKQLMYQFQGDGTSLKISHYCCHEMKKSNFKKWETENKKGIKIVGIRMDEGGGKEGCIKNVQSLIQEEI